MWTAGGELERCRGSALKPGWTEEVNAFFLMEIHIILLLTWCFQKAFLSAHMHNVSNPNSCHKSENVSNYLHDNSGQRVTRRHQILHDFISQLRTNWPRWWLTGIHLVRSAVIPKNVFKQSGWVSTAYTDAQMTRCPSSGNQQPLHWDCLMSTCSANGLMWKAMLSTHMPTFTV